MSLAMKEKEEEIFERYIRRFKELDLDSHHVMLLVSLLMLHKNDTIDLREIKLNSKLKKTWLELWDCLDHEKSCKVYDAFYQLKSLDFCNLEFKDGIKKNPPTSWDSLKWMIERAYFDDDLVDLIDHDEYYERLIHSLLNGADLPEKEKDKLKVKIDLIEVDFLEKEKFITQVR